MVFTKGNQINKGRMPWNKGKKETRPEVLYKNGLAHRGRHHTEECKKRISLAVSATLMGHKVSEETKRKMSLLKRGDKCHFWKGGIAGKNNSERNNAMKTPEYRQWRRMVFERDNYTCQDCGAKSGNGKTVVLNADHIRAFADYPKLRFELSNGRTLCVDCHKQTNNYGWKKYHNNRNNFLGIGL